jgi:hypothetical protein
LPAAVAAARRVCVSGDYVVDGVGGPAILLRCLRLPGADPDRKGAAAPAELTMSDGVSSIRRRPVGRRGRECADGC